MELSPSRVRERCRGPLSKCASVLEVITSLGSDVILVNKIDLYVQNYNWLRH